MKRLHLRLFAPFAAFRPLQAGTYRTTVPVMPPTSAAGLVLNLAGVETRDLSREGRNTRMRADAPRLRIAVGRTREPELASFYQQLHGYPVGNSGKELAARTHGAKYWIAPVRREVLVGYAGAIAVEGDSVLLDRVSLGLRGELEGARYGLPFAGDNQFLIDRIEIAETCAHWYDRIDAMTGPVKGSVRLTLSIDRDDSSRTQVGLFAPTEQESIEPPETAWTWVPAQP